jgi:ComF family protein
LADLLWRQLVREDIDITGVSFICHVPLHRQRRRKRGFDQAELLARRLSALSGLPLKSGLTREIDTPSQVGLGLHERRANVDGAFAWRGEVLSGESILILDDVVTTGSTINSAAQALIEAGAGRVDGLSIARQIAPH